MLTEIFAYIGIEEPFQKIVLREIDIPIISSSYQAVSHDYFSYPPMLVPTFADYDIPLINGILLHPFSSKNLSFVRFNLVEGYFREIGFNSHQVITQMILEMIMVEEEVSEEISKFCYETKYTYLREVNLFSDKFGDNHAHFNQLVYFQNNLPLHYCKDLKDYKGSFLSSDDLLNPSVINDSSSFELSDKILSRMDMQRPIWFENDNLIEAFYDFMSQNKFREAWLCLNSGNWTLDDLSKGLLHMKNNVSDPLFVLLCDYWLTNNSN